MKYGVLRSLGILLIILFSLLSLYSLVLAATKILDQSIQENTQTQSDPVDEKTRKFFTAVEDNSLKDVKALLDSGVDVNALNESRSTALHLAGSPEILHYLIKSGADLEARDDLGLTPLFYKGVGLARILIEAGADINARSARGNTPFMWYCYSGYLEGMKYLAGEGAELDTCNYEGNNAAYIVDHFQPNTEAFYYVMSLKLKACRK